MFGSYHLETSNTCLNLTRIVLLTIYGFNVLPRLHAISVESSNRYRFKFGAKVFDSVSLNKL